jgi:hypothetical protein
MDAENPIGTEYSVDPHVGPHGGPFDRPLVRPYQKSRA